MRRTQTPLWGAGRAGRETAASTRGLLQVRHHVRSPGKARRCHSSHGSRPGLTLSWAFRWLQSLPRDLRGQREVGISIASRLEALKRFTHGGAGTRRLRCRWRKRDGADGAPRIGRDAPLTTSLQRSISPNDPVVLFLLAKFCSIGWLQGSTALLLDVAGKDLDLPVAVQFIASGPLKHPSVLGRRGPHRRGGRGRAGALPAG